MTQEKTKFGPGQRLWAEILADSFRIESNLGFWPAGLLMKRKAFLVIVELFKSYNPLIAAIKPEGIFSGRKICDLNGYPVIISDAIENDFAWFIDFPKG